MVMLLVFVVINIKLFWGNITTIFIFILNKRKCKNAAGASTGGPPSAPLAAREGTPLPAYEYSY